MRTAYNRCRRTAKLTGFTSAMQQFLSKVRMVLGGLDENAATFRPSDVARGFERSKMLFDALQLLNASSAVKFLIVSLLLAFER
jgi:hypothetical protein